MRLLITCFEPFGGAEKNASQEAVMALPNEICGIVLQKRCLPVVFGAAGEQAIEAIDELAPHAVICVGEAGGRAAITPEMVALNLRHARIADNAGAMPHDEPVVAGGENALFSTLPVRAMAEAINAAGVPAEVSYSAGTYVCNDTMYLVLAHLLDKNVPAGFVHVPAGNALSIDSMVAGLTAAIGALA